LSVTSSVGRKRQSTMSLKQVTEKGCTCFDELSMNGFF
jgi:hypothetical protein